MNLFHIFHFIFQEFLNPSQIDCTPDLVLISECLLFLQVFHSYFLRDRTHLRSKVPDLYSHTFQRILSLLAFEVKQVYRKRTMVIYPVVHISVPCNSFPYFSEIPYQFLHFIICLWNVSKLVSMKKSIPMFIQLFDNFLKSRMCG